LNRNSIIFVKLDVVEHNVDALQTYLKPGTKQMAVVKANAYGHGAVEVARKIAPKVDWFAVNDIDEGIELRNHHITKPILVFTVPTADTSPLYKKYDLTATISDLGHFAILPEGSEYHLNFDTGMGRLGIRPELAGETAESVRTHPLIHCTGIYSHFAAADEPGAVQTVQQHKRFEKICIHFDRDLLTHLCNTAGAVQHREAQHDMVRTGIGLYGYAPGKVQIPRLKPVLNWRTHLALVKPIKKGEPVSYGASWHAPDDGFCGIIPVGYSDGIPRGLSGNFNVRIEGRTYPVVGRITMNYCVVFLGDESIKQGSRVYLLYDQLTSRHWAEATDTIVYEIVTNLSDRILRKYTEG
jgi:alanine racemase